MATKKQSKTIRNSFTRLTKAREKLPLINLQDVLKDVSIASQYRHHSVYAISDSVCTENSNTRKPLNVQGLAGK